MMPFRLSPGLCRASVLLALCADAAFGQAVRFSVSDSASSRPLDNAEVTVINAGGRSTAVSWTKEDGVTSMVLAPGRYRVRARHIGFRPATIDSIVIGSGRPYTFRLMLVHMPALLAGMRIEGNRRCDASQDPVTSDVWQTARNAFGIMESNERREDLWFKVADGATQYSEPKDSLRSLAVTEREGSSVSPYHSLSPDSVSQGGFVRSLGSSTLFLAPDTRVLTSDSFFADHCFAIQKLSDADSVVEIAFEPARGRTVPDISGVVTIDRSSYAVLSVSFAFTGLPRASGRACFGGSVTFQEIRSAGWLTSRWSVVAPVLEIRRHDKYVGGFGGSTLSRVTSVDSAVFASRVEFGRLLMARQRPGPVLWAERLGTIQGRVVDSDSRHPVQGATAHLASFRRSASTDENGQFVLDSLLPGQFILSVSALGGLLHLDTIVVASADHPAAVVQFTLPFERTQASQIAERAKEDASLCQRLRSQRYDELAREFSRDVQGWYPEGRDSTAIATAMQTAAITVEAIVDTAGLVEMSSARVVRQGSPVALNAAYSALTAAKLMPDMPRNGCTLPRLLILPLKVGQSP